jgi:hypothetical protein
MIDDRDSGAVVEQFTGETQVNAKKKEVKLSL